MTRTRVGAEVFASELRERAGSDEGLKLAAGTESSLAG
jgi:hypothetical protein